MGRPRFIGRLGTGSRLLDVGLVLVVLILLAAALQTLLLGPDALQGSVRMRLRPPGTLGYPLGTDQLGRSVLVRTLAGIPWSLGIGAVASAIAVIIGVAAGLIAAWDRNWLRRGITLGISTVIAFPTLIIALVLIAIIGRGFWPTALTMGLIVWPTIARVVYAEAMSVIEHDYILSARLFGVPTVLILLGHVLLGLRPLILVLAASAFSVMLVFESALSFLGLGAPPGYPSWGNMLADSRQYLFNAPWMMLAPAGAICITVVALNLVADGIGQLSRRQTGGLLSRQM